MRLIVITEPSHPQTQGERVKIAGVQVPKWLVFVAAAFVAVLIAGVANNIIDAVKRSRPTTPTVSATPAPQAAEPLADFRVVKVDDASVGSTPRLVYSVVVAGRPTPKQLTRVAAAVFEKAKAGKSFSALRIGFYDAPEFVGREYTLGAVDYAPQGEWADASTIAPGDYAAMKARADLPSKDWSRQLSAREIKVWAAWRAAYDAAAKAIGSQPGKAVDEAAITAKVAKATGTSPSQVQAILIKQQVWSSR
jgi:hypothetical protein